MQSFTHPESSHSILAQEAEDLFSRHDVNGDGIITSEEYQKDPYIEFEEEVDYLTLNPKYILLNLMVHFETNVEKFTKVFVIEKNGMEQ